MSSSDTMIAHVLEKSMLRPQLSARKLFGEYALTLDAKVVALVCDNQLFLKDTAAGRALVLARSGRLDLQPPYPGAKPSLRLDAELDEPALLRELLLCTAAALPAPKPKPKLKPKPV